MVAGVEETGEEVSMLLVGVMFDIQSLERRVMRMKNLNTKLWELTVT